MRTAFIAGNWKMFKTAKEAKEFAEEFKKIYKPSDTRVAIAAPFTDLVTLKESFEGTGIGVSAQNMHFEDSGAFTGEISAAMLKEIGVDYCIIGHSERRQHFGETDRTVNKKLHKALEAGILPIVCIGESIEIRQSGEHVNYVSSQLRAALDGIKREDISKITLAYEPIWAIGSSLPASSEQAQEMCCALRKVVKELYGNEAGEDVTIQYGGSVKPGNINELMQMEDIDGALVGGASLKPSDFNDIVNFRR